MPPHSLGYFPQMDYSAAKKMALLPKMVARLFFSFHIFKCFAQSFCDQNALLSCGRMPTLMPPRPLFVFAGGAEVLDGDEGRRRFLLR